MNMTKYNQRLTVKVGLERADEVTDSTAEATEEDASVAVSSRSSRTSALETAAQRPRAKRALTRILSNCYESIDG